MKQQYGFYLNTDRCIQCHACELACKSWNGLSPGIQWRKVMDIWQGRFPDVTDRTVSFSCAHCEKPSCLDACPERAISKDPDNGIVSVDPGKCSGCKTCLTACPFRVPQYGEDGIMQKCDMCLERLNQGKGPSCVSTCPGEALQFGTIEDLLEKLQYGSGERLAGPTLPCLFISGKLTGALILEMLRQ
ncbi:MAG: 4Fe-4S dicluster domain-containing protein [Acidobacteriota bacterium]